MTSASTAFYDAHAQRISSQRTSALTVAAGRLIGVVAFVIVFGTVAT